MNRRSIAEVPPIPKPRESLLLSRKNQSSSSLQSSPSHNVGLRGPLQRARVTETPAVMVAPIPSIRYEVQLTNFCFATSCN